jgi:MFS family permease
VSTGDPTSEDQRWQELAEELTPAKSLARIDAATARVVSTVSVVALLLTGLGLVAADRLGDGAPRVWALVTVVLALAAIVCALSAQVVTITRGLNTGNLVEVEDWYRSRFDRRAPLTRAASLLLLAAVVTAGVAGFLAAVEDDASGPVLGLTRTTELLDDGTPGPTGTVTVSAKATGLEPGSILTLTVAVEPEYQGSEVDPAAEAPVAQAAVAAGADGVAEHEVSIAKVAATATVSVQAVAGGQTCTAEGAPGGVWRVSC